MPADLNRAAAPCPCGLPTRQPARLQACCGRWLAGPLHLQAPDAVALMRSRYSAYVLQDAAYLRDTWHASTRPPSIDFEPGLRWLGLQVQQSVVLDGDHATVRFVARSKLAGRAHRLVETSRFVREDGRWLYLDSEIDGGNTGL